MERRVIYCEVDFLKNLVMGFSKKTFDKKIRSTRIIELLSISPIVFNVSKDKLRSDEVLKDNFLFEYIWKRSLEDNNGKQRWSYDSFCDFCNVPQKNIELSSILLTTKSELDCNRIMKKWGILAFNNETLLNSEHLFEDCGTALPDSRKVKNGWKSILTQIKYINYCNSLIIIDNYLLQADNKQTYANKSVKEKIENNLIPILEVLLPKEISIPFHLYIFACEDSYPFKSLMDKEKEESLYSSIRGIRGGKVPIEIKLINCKKTFHDRVILSNNIWISSGMGFDLFREDDSQINKPTTVSILFPFINCSSSWVKTAYENIIGTAQRVSKSNIGDGDDFLNRLLEWNEEDNKDKTIVSNTKYLGKIADINMSRQYKKREQ